MIILFVDRTKGNRKMEKKGNKNNNQFDLFLTN